MTYNRINTKRSIKGIMNVSQYWRFRTFVGCYVINVECTFLINSCDFVANNLVLQWSDCDTINQNQVRGDEMEKGRINLGTSFFYFVKNFHGFK